MQSGMTKFPFINNDAGNESNGVQKYRTKEMENLLVQFEVCVSHAIRNVRMEEHFVQQQHENDPNDKQIGQIHQKV